MKYTTASTFAFVIGALVVAACGGAEAPPAQPDDDSSQSGGTRPSDAGTNTNTKQCVSSCNSDSECANSCPSTAGGTPCCDLVTKTCFNSQQSTCPKSDPDAGGGPLQY